MVTQFRCLLEVKGQVETALLWTVLAGQREVVGGNCRRKVGRKVGQDLSRTLIDLHRKLNDRPWVDQTADRNPHANAETTRDRNQSRLFAFKGLTNVKEQRVNWNAETVIAPSSKAASLPSDRRTERRRPTRTSLATDRKQLLPTPYLPARPCPIVRSRTRCQSTRCRRKPLQIASKVVKKKSGQ
jgi:hypothetical protein